MSMHSGNDDVFPKMAYVLFETNLAYQCPGYRNPVAFFLALVVVVGIVLEKVQVRAVVLASGNQHN